MAKLLKLTVERIDGSKDTYPVLAKTKIAFERHFGVGIGTLGESKRTEHVYWLAWDAEHTAGKVVKLFDDWANDIADVDVDEESAPLDAAASPPQ
ncbi:MAG: hypothetical protein JWO62_2573 [Acidimicrobiaceae bacterium]|nr:hypothetical protein [Acidimicrobiaceae bacterium]